MSGPSYHFWNAVGFVPPTGIAVTFAMEWPQLWFAAWIFGAVACGFFLAAFAGWVSRR